MRESMPTLMMSESMEILVDWTQRTKATLREEAQGMFRGMKCETGDMARVETKGILVVDENHGGREYGHGHGMPR